MQTVKNICVCGAGTMGSGITQLAAMAGFSAIQFDVNENMLFKSKAGIESSLQRLAERNKISEEEKILALQRIIFTNNIYDCKADLVIEAIIENKAAKIDLFTQLASVNNDDSIFATNTSSISVSEMANEITNPQRVAGMHFFNPAPLMKLVEVIKAENTNEETLQAILLVAKRMGKTPVVCNDAPGFIVNRVARQYYLEAMELVELGFTNIETIDTAMEAAGFKMGPFKLMDLIGLDINYSVSNIVWEALGKPLRLQPSFLQKGKVERGTLGRKTGEGFYKY